MKSCKILCYNAPNLLHYYSTYIHALFFFFIVDVMNYYLNIQEPSPTLVLQISYGHFQQ